MKVSASVERGWIRGSLQAGEDKEQIIALLHHAKSQVLDGKLSLLVHEHLKKNPNTQIIEQTIDEKLRLLYQNHLKRWVIQTKTRSGPRIVKIAEAASFKTSIAGACAQSVASREHRFQKHTESIGLAAAQSKGYLELWHGATLVRSCQVQSPIEHDDCLILSDHLAQALEQDGLAAMEPLARALGHSHDKGFFHGDLKGFHALALPQAQTKEYTLLWLDLARVGFKLSRRKRIINLYQMLRFVVPERGEARESFMRAYCNATGWYADNPHKAMTVVGKFLEHKLINHPNP